MHWRIQPINWKKNNLSQNYKRSRFWASKALDQQHDESKVIICDQGKQYTSDEFQNMCNDNNIKPHLTSTNNPRGNAKVGKIHRTINEILRMKEGIRKVRKKTSLILNRSIDTTYTLFHKIHPWSNNTLPNYDELLIKAPRHQEKFWQGSNNCEKSFYTCCSGIFLYS